MSVEEQLFEAADGDRVSEVSSLLRDHPGINVNWTDSRQETSLHVASRNGHVEVVKLLLAHPDINVNLKSRFGDTSLSVACERGHVSVVQVLLKYPRVDVTLDDYWGRTPLWHASSNGKLEVIEWLVASGRGLEDVKNKKDYHDQTALEIVRERNMTEVASLLERFIANPALIRHEVRVKLGVLDELAAEVFALTVFLCEDFLQPKPASPPVASPNPATDAATRFFEIASKLPMELQMMLCHCAVGSTKQNILHKDSEPAFKALARILSSESH